MVLVIWSVSTCHEVSQVPKATLSVKNLKWQSVSQDKGKLPVQNMGMAHFSFAINFLRFVTMKISISPPSATPKVVPCNTFLSDVGDFFLQLSQLLCYHAVKSCLQILGKFMFEIILKAKQRYS